ncbi:hypothetical protein SAMN05216325_1393 [Nitrosomonas marina]|uniref:Uncharacterized protein n=1 Tax=Nitrosomonas marina TaxID=917 RepID=A0A1H8IRB0_9PROT|nr:hypothetical protein SAMN05216325_1393 [Nitrosomonas marina]
MARCLGTIVSNDNKRICHHTLYRCKNCGNIGCDFNYVIGCSSQGFLNGKCIICGESGQIEVFDTGK